jgi:hypothetical protein
MVKILAIIVMVIAIGEKVRREEIRRESGEMNILKRGNI